MRRRLWIACSSVGALLAISCDKPAEEPLSLVVQGDSSSVRRVEHPFKQMRHVHVPDSGARYSIRLVEPDPSIDYKIAQIYPDTSIDYTIAVIDPKSAADLSPLSRSLDDAIRVVPRGRVNGALERQSK